jgi:uncharacterized membrane protein YbhN (UPF0104 family)
MKRSMWRPIAAVTVLVITIAAFIAYFIKHPEVRQQLSQTSLATMAIILALYLIGIVALAFATIATLRLCKVRLHTHESLLLTMYAAIINFFGPLQSGPAFRAVYLKKKHGINLKNYTVATLVYYCFYGGFSVLLLLSGLLKWWLVPLTLAGLLCALAASRSKRLKPRMEQLDLHGWYYLAAATLAQIVVVTLIYYTELRTVQPGVHFSQAVIYTGAANLALFVSITPGAIGFRESFLLFSQHLHHISNGTIVAANILDRAMYLILLGILALFIFATHAKQQLGIKPKATE